MESLTETAWDVLIAGTGLQQSLLALALSRSGKKVLHVDRNRYYGGDDAAFSLQEAEDWVTEVGQARLPTFKEASISREESTSSTEQVKGIPSLSFSRAYSLSLSPELIYTRSKLLPLLVSSKSSRQLEFLAVGSWWVYDVGQSADESADHGTVRQRGRLQKVPNGREDVFSDESIDLRSKRALMKFLKFVGSFEDYEEEWLSFASKPFPEFLTSKFKLPAALQKPLLALTLSPDVPNKTTTAFAIPRIARHLRSIGVFGPGFGAVLAKWGGGAEIAQVACRAGAVGGGVYVLDQGVKHVSSAVSETAHSSDEPKSDKRQRVDIQLDGGDTVSSQWVVGSASDIASHGAPAVSDAESSVEYSTVARSITIVSASLSSLFPVTAEGAPSPAGAVVAFPTGSLQGRAEQEEQPPVYILVHSSDTGECPSGQCILYASTLDCPDAHALLDEAVSYLVDSSSDETAPPQILYSLRYKQQGPESSSTHSVSDLSSLPVSALQTDSDRPAKVYLFSPPSLDLAFDDRILDAVKQVWKNIIGEEVDESSFMVFEERNGMGEDGEDGRDVDEE
ncbi:MAG: hypothetical protein M1819_004204 [Sarea resinae]|nr:MAG: hypothetical protein M1819_004204 [Sarea resinae]